MMCCLSFYSCQSALCDVVKSGSPTSTTSSGGLSACHANCYTNLKGEDDG
jgi:hypothetical protein